MILLIICKIPFHFYFIFSFFLQFLRNRFVRQSIRTHSKSISTSIKNNSNFYTTICSFYQSIDNTFISQKIHTHKYFIPCSRTVNVLIQMLSYFCLCHKLKLILIIFIIKSCNRISIFLIFIFKIFIFFRKFSSLCKSFCFLFHKFFLLILNFFNLLFSFTFRKIICLTCLIIR